jgi:hypothetical protein
MSQPAPQESVPRRPPLVVRLYWGCARFLFNALVLFIILNLIIWAGSLVRRSRHTNPVEEKYSTDLMRKIYAPMSDDQWRLLLFETWHRPWIFEQFVQIKEAPFRGKYVNVSEQGYRVVPRQGPWPIDRGNYNVLILGGSTTFGYGVADDQTVPACMQEILSGRGGPKRVCVYNFGRSLYYSTPERILFEQLLLSGARPDLVIFIDGINDFNTIDDVFANTPHLTRAMEPDSGKALRNQSMEIFKSLPVGKLVDYLSWRFRPPPPARNTEALLPGVVARYVWNKQAIESVAAANHVACIFVFQPSPLYGYDLKYHLFQGTALALNRDSIAGYALMVQYVKDHPMGDDFLWLAEIQRGVEKPLYCDEAHYTAEFCRQIAQEIFKFLEKKHHFSERTTFPSNGSAGGVSEWVWQSER